MTDTPAASPQLSPEFDRARKLSRILEILLTIAFWGGVVAGPLGALWVLNGVGEHHWLPHIPPFHNEFPKPVAAVLVILVLIPSLGALFFARRVFAQFAKGEVFAAETIAHMRTAALWVTIAGIVPPRAIVLVVGIAGYVATYVMAEARRIADDNAGIV